MNAPGRPPAGQTTDVADAPAVEATSRREVDPSSLRVVRLGHGANCSSIGSVVDTLFASAAVGAAVFAAVVAALKTERASLTASAGDDEERESEREQAPP